MDKYGRRGYAGVDAKHFLACEDSVSLTDDGDNRGGKEIGDGRHEAGFSKCNKVVARESGVHIAEALRAG